MTRFFSSASKATVGSVSVYSCHLHCPHQPIVSYKKYAVLLFTAPTYFPFNSLFLILPVADLNMAIPFKEALQRLENRRVKSTRPLIPPQILQEDLPLCVLVLGTTSCLR
jgi:hypothetical protein